MKWPVTKLKGIVYQKMKTNVDPNSYDFFSSGKHKEYILILRSVLYFENAITVILNFEAFKL